MHRYKQQKLRLKLNRKCCIMGICLEASAQYEYSIQFLFISYTFFNILIFPVQLLEICIFLVRIWAVFANCIFSQILPFCIVKYNACVCVEIWIYSFISFNEYTKTISCLSLLYIYFLVGSTPRKLPTGSRLDSGL